MADTVFGEDAVPLEDGTHARDSAHNSKNRRHGGGGPVGGSSTRNREIMVSKALSKLLRHQAENVGITLDEQGFAPLDKVLAWGSLKSLRVTLDEVQSIVQSNDKQRFTLKPNPATNPELSTARSDAASYLIRANQGHSIKIESTELLKPISLDDVSSLPRQVLHGTYFAFWPAILASGGLKPMGRNHVHCSTGTPEDGVTSGMRRDAELIIEIDVERSLQEGIKWWLSDNGVILSEGDGDGVVSTRFFRKVTGRRIDVGVLFEDGEKVTDLPPGIKASVPYGKEPRQKGGGRGGRGIRGGQGTIQ